MVSYYNPLTSTGRENIKNYIILNKTTIKVVTIVVMIIVLFVGAISYYFDSGLSKQGNFERYVNLPRPRYGNGPFGYGLYAPPESVIVQSLVYN